MSRSDPWGTPRFGGGVPGLAGIQWPFVHGIRRRSVGAEPLGGQSHRAWYAVKMAVESPDEHPPTHSLPEGLTAFDVPTVRMGVKCLKCSYELGGLGTGARCPECGLEVRESLRRPIRGSFLRSRVVWRLGVGFAASVFCDFLGAGVVAGSFGPCGAIPRAMIGPPLFAVGPLIGAFGYSVLGSSGRSDGLVVIAWAFAVVVVAATVVVDIGMESDVGGMSNVIRGLVIVGSLAWAMRNHLAIRVVTLLNGPAVDRRASRVVGLAGSCSWVGAVCAIASAACSWLAPDNVDLAAVLFGVIGIVSVVAVQVLMILEVCTIQATVRR